MADNVGYTPGVGALVAADEIAGVLHQRIKLGIGADGVAVDVSAANPMPITTSSPIAVTGGLTDAELRATPVPISGALTDTQLRATPVPISASVPLAVTGPLTDVELRAVPVQVQDESADFLLNRMLVQLAGPQGYDMSLQRYRQTAVIESGTVTTVGTVNTIQTLAALGGIQAQILPNAANLAAWHACCRSRIT